MKTTELRIGNLVLLDGEEMIITGITEDYVYFEGGFSMIIFTDIKGIPLTEEWLLKFGFWRWRAGSRSWIINESVLDKIGTTTHRFYLATSSKKYAVKTGYYYEARTGYYPSTFLRYIKYVHQLQNLYFALTGEELEIKTNQNLKL